MNRWTMYENYNVIQSGLFPMRMSRGEQKISRIVEAFA